MTNYYLFLRYHKAHLTRRLILDCSTDSDLEENMVEWLRVCYPLYLTVGRRRQGDYKLIITEPDVTNYFSINFQLNIMSLSRQFCVYSQFTPLFTLWR